MTSSRCLAPRRNGWLSRLVPHFGPRRGFANLLWVRSPDHLRGRPNPCHAVALAVRVGAEPGSRAALGPATHGGRGAEDSLATTIFSFRDPRRSPRSLLRADDRVGDRSCRVGFRRRDENRGVTHTVRLPGHTANVASVRAASSSLIDGAAAYRAAVRAVFAWAIDLAARPRPMRARAPSSAPR